MRTRIVNQLQAVALKLEFPGFQSIAIALSGAIQSESWLL
jgi:hypothetical protein